MKLFLGIISLLILTGCSHNVVTYSDGIGLETTINPETYTVGLNFRYGKILTVCVRENSEVSMKGKTSLANSTKTETSVDGEVKVRIGHQITGYQVDLEKVKK